MPNWQLYIYICIYNVYIYELMRVKDALQLSLSLFTIGCRADQQVNRLEFHSETRDWAKVHWNYLIRSSSRLCLSYSFSPNNCIVSCLNHCLTSRWYKCFAVSDGFSAEGESVLVRSVHTKEQSKLAHGSDKMGCVLSTSDLQLGKLCVGRVTSGLGQEPPEESQRGSHFYLW